MHAGDGAARGAFLHGAVFAADVFNRVLHQRLGGVAALLRAVVHQAVLTDVQIAGAGAAAPFVLDAVGDVVLEIIDLRVAALFHGAHSHVHFAFRVAERLQLAFAVVDDSNCGGEAQLHSPGADHLRVARVLNPAAYDRVDVYVKVSVLGQNL